MLLAHPQPSTSLSAISRTSPSSTLSSVRRPALCRGAGAASPAPHAGAQARQVTGVAMEDAGREPYSRAPNSGDAALEEAGTTSRPLATSTTRYRRRVPAQQPVAMGPDGRLPPLAQHRVPVLRGVPGCVAG